MRTLEGSSSHASTQMVSAKRKEAPAPSLEGSSSHPSSSSTKRKSALIPDPDPAKRKVASALERAKRKAAPAESSGRGLSSQKTKMTTTKPDGKEQEESRQEAPAGRPARVQIFHSYKLTRSFDFKSVSSPGEAKLITDRGHYNGGQTNLSPDFQNERRQLDWLFPTKIERLQELTRKLGFSRGGEVVDLLLDTIPISLLGFQDYKARTYHQQTLHSSPANPPFNVGFSGTYPSQRSPLFPAPQFSQNPQGIGPNSFTPTGGLGADSPFPAPQFSQNQQGVATNSFTPTSGPGAASPFLAPQFSQNRQGVAPNSFTSTGGLGAASPFPAPVQFSQNPQGVAPNSFTPTGGLGAGGTIRTPGRPTQIGGLEGATIPTPTPTGGVGRGSTAGYYSNPRTSISTPSKCPHTPTPRAVHSSTGPLTAHPSDLPMPSTFNFNGFRGGYLSNNDTSRMLQQHEVRKQLLSLFRNRLLSHLSHLRNSHHERERTSQAENRSQAMQLPVKSGHDTRSRHLYLMRDSTPNPSPSQNILNQVQAPTERTVDVDNPNQLAVEGHQDGRGSEGSPGAAEANKTNIVHVDAVNVKEADA